MKININGKEVDLIVNGEQPTVLAKKVRMMDHGINPDDAVRKLKEDLEKTKEKSEE